jgi:hypothetical protein
VDRIAALDAGKNLFIEHHRDPDAVIGISSRPAP